MLQLWYTRNFILRLHKALINVHLHVHVKLDLLHAV